MNQKHSPRYYRIKEALLLPLLIGMILAFCSFEEVVAEASAPNGAESNFETLGFLQSIATEVNKKDSLEWDPKNPPLFKLEGKIISPEEAEELFTSGEYLITWDSYPHKKLAKKFPQAKNGVLYFIKDKRPKLSIEEKAQREERRRQRMEKDTVNRGSMYRIEKIHGNERKFVSSGNCKFNFSPQKGEKFQDIQSSDSGNELKLKVTGENGSYLLKVNDKGPDKQPLYVIDGKIEELNSLKDFDVEKIQSISVLKNQAAIEAYGSRGENGVVVITTKSKVDSQRQKRIEGFSGQSNKKKEMDERIEVVAEIIDITGLGGENRPYTIIDGVPANENGLESLDPERIDNIKILKGPSATALFGKQGKDGVMLITTKEAAQKKSHDAPEVKVESQLFNLRGEDGNNPPYIILNGKPVSQDEFHSIDPEEIENIAVLKGVSAIKSYGEKGQNGVMLVETKKFAKAKKNSLSESVREKSTEKVRVVGYGKMKSPYIILDGKPLSVSEFNALNLSHVNILGEISAEEALANYGVKGIKGTIPIATTKKGKEKIIGDDSDRKKESSILNEKGFIKNPPLYILDGKPASLEEIDALEQGMVEKINVIKGKEARKKYGRKAKNGVIIITTKTEEN